MVKFGFRGYWIRFGFSGSLVLATKSVSKGTVGFGSIFGIACYVSGSGFGFGFICIGLL